MLLRREGIVSTINSSKVILGVAGEGVFWKRELVFQASKFVITASLRAQSYCGLVIHMKPQVCIILHIGTCSTGRVNALPICS